MNDTNDNTNADISAHDPAMTRKRRRGLIALGIAASFGALAYGAYWTVALRHFEATDDAYVAGDMVQITSEVPGTVMALHADDTQGVKREQTLIELDPADAQVATGSAEAHLAHAVRQVRALFAEREQLRAQLAEREIALRTAQADYRRRAGLLEGGAVSSEELAHNKDGIAQMQAALRSAREQLNTLDAQIDGTTVTTHPQVLAAAAAVRDAALALRRTKINAPVAGVIARRSVQVGQRVAPGTPLMAVVPLDAVWVDANFKEVQLADMRVGQPVTLEADLYGDKAEYHGRLVGLAAGSGNAFALLPSQNASGNWIKIVQRVPVRIALDAAELHAHPLRVGLSMSVRVNVHDTSGQLIASQVRSTPMPVQASLGSDPQVEARIAQIIAANDGNTAVASALP